MRVLHTTAAVLVGLALSCAVQAEEPPGPAEAKRMAFEEFLDLRSEAKLVVIDVRSTEAFVRGHIAGAWSVPVGKEAEHEERLRAAGKPIAVYCA